MKSLLVQKNKSKSSVHRINWGKQSKENSKREWVLGTFLCEEEVKEGETIEVEMNERTRKNDEKCL